MNKLIKPSCFHKAIYNTNKTRYSTFQASLDSINIASDHDKSLRDVKKAELPLMLFFPLFD